MNTTRRAEVASEIASCEVEGERHVDLDGAPYDANPNRDGSELPSEQHWSAAEWAEGWVSELRRGGK